MSTATPQETTVTEQHSPLHDEHVALGATMTPFAGWLMPLRYSSDIAEHTAVRTAAGLFDLSHMGEIAVQGPDAAAFLDHALVGAIRLFHVRRGVAQTGSVGYWIGQPHIRQGHMADAVETLIRFAFKGLGLHRLEAACMPENHASAALLQKCGFSEEGYAPAYLKINGGWRDHRLFGLVASE